MVTPTKNKAAKIKQIIALLEFVLLLDDEEIMRSSLETIIEMLKEIE